MRDMIEYCIKRVGNEFEFTKRRLPQQFNVKEPQFESPTSDPGILNTIDKKIEGIIEITNKWVPHNKRGISRSTKLISLPDEEHFKDLGALMYNLLIPEGLQKDIKEGSIPLVIRTNQPSFPWELIYYEGNFLCLKRPVVRGIWGKQDDNEKIPSLKSRGVFSILIISDPRDRFSEAKLEVDELISLLPDNVGFKLLSGKEANFVTVTELLSKGTYNMIHYSGEVGFDEEKEETYLELADKNLFISTITKTKIITGNPFIFINGCKSSKGEVAAENLAIAFLNKGAIGFVGTLWRVSDVGARCFATNFYRFLFKGWSLGEAGKLARIKTKKELKTDFTWASIVIYGDPYMQIIKPVDFDKCSSEVEQVLNYALQEARNLKHKLIDIPHILIGLSKIEGGVFQSGLENHFFSPEDIQEVVYEIIGEGSVKQYHELSLIEDCFTPDAWKVLEVARKKAQKRSSNFIEEIDLVEATIENLNGLLKEVLEQLGLEFTTFPIPIFIKKRLNKNIFTTTAFKTIHIALKEAFQTGCNLVESSHIFIALTKIENGYTQSILNHYKVDVKTLQNTFRSFLSRSDKVLQNYPTIVVRNYFSKKALEILYEAKRETSLESSTYIDEKHLLRALLKKGDNITRGILKGEGLDIDQMFTLTIEDEILGRNSNGKLSE